MIAVDLSKQQTLNTDCKAIQKIDFTANVDRAENIRIYLILVLWLFTRYYKSFVNMLLNDLIPINIKWHNTKV